MRFIQKNIYLILSSLVVIFFAGLGLGLYYSDKVVKEPYEKTQCIVVDQYPSISLVEFLYEYRENPVVTNVTIETLDDYQIDSNHTCYVTDSEISFDSKLERKDKSLMYVGLGLCLCSFGILLLVIILLAVFDERRQSNKDIVVN